MDKNLGITTIATTIFKKLSKQNNYFNLSTKLKT